MIRFPVLLTLLLAIITLSVTGCGDDRPLGPTGPLSIPFELTTSFLRPDGDYFAISGIVTRSTTIISGDSTIESTFPAFYAQFHADPGLRLPQVLLNKSRFERHRGGDTLRLASSSGTSVYGDNTWTLIDTVDGDTASHLVSKVDVIDTLEPFAFKKNFRSDTSLTIRWKRPSFGSSGLILIWDAVDHTVVKSLQDGIGYYEIDRSDMLRLRGKGKITLIRYLNIEKSYKGKKLVLTRIAERSYDVTVE